ncbi:MAG: response regulator transcription factor [Bacteroidales bacterium]
MKRILIVEDDIALCTLLAHFMRENRFEVEECHTLKDAHIKLRLFVPDLVILDIYLVDGHGMDLAHKIRRESMPIPVIYTTACSDKETIEVGNFTAEDFILKPYNKYDLLAKVKKNLGDVPSKNIRKIGRYGYIPENGQLVFQDGSHETLTYIESEILNRLSVNLGKPIRKADLIDSVWNKDEKSMSKSLDGVIVKLRKHFVRDPQVCFKSLKNYGYKLMVNPERTESM